MLLIKPIDIDAKVWNGPFGHICNELMQIKEDSHVDLWDDTLDIHTYMDVVSQNLQCQKFVTHGCIGSSRIIDYDEKTSKIGIPEQ